jgi:hypothetical protein
VNFAGIFYYEELIAVVNPIPARKSRKTLVGDAGAVWRVGP